MSTARLVTPRPEYVALVDGLPALMRDLGSTITPANLRDVRVFMLALEHIDRVLDAIVDRADRRAFGERLLAAIANGDARFSDIELGELYAVLARRGRTAAFVALARTALVNSERMRTTRDAHEYLDAIELEGRLTVELVLLFVDPDAGPAVAAFLRAVGDIANLFDKLIDMRADHRRGELALRPSIRLHARVLARILRRLPSVAATHPRRLRFVGWSVGWVRRMLAA